MKLHLKANKVRVLEFDCLNIKDIPLCFILDCICQAKILTSLSGVEQTLTLIINMDFQLEF